jgi:hypothetical protein
MWSFKKYVIIMIALPWVYGIFIAVYVILTASDNIRSYECNSLNSIHPELAAPVITLTNLILTFGVIVVYSIGIYKSIKSGKKYMIL